MSDDMYEGLKEIYDNFFKEYQCEIENDNQYYNSIITSNENKDEINRLLLSMLEKERQRIARDLHDTSLQHLTHLIHKIELSSMYIDEDSIKAKLELAAVNKNLKLIIKDIRNIIYDLRPMTFEDIGFKETIDSLINKLSNNSDIEIETFIEELECNDPLILMTIFRIVEECLNNALKHSFGNKVILTLKNLNDNHCSIVIEDNGKSFDFNKINYFDSGRHFGLCILRERVELLSGKLNIYPNPGIGTTIEMFIPLLK